MVASNTCTVQPCVIILIALVATVKDKALALG